jgi:5-hydroxyisourate hydrolase-like protein (transthyretin family)
MHPTARSCAWLALLLALGCNSGPRRPPTYAVTGTVTQNGKPLEAATVVFVPLEGAVGQEAATGVTDAQGRFKLTMYKADDGANAGEYRIKVSKFDNKKPTKEEQASYISYEEEQKMQFSADEKPTPPSKNLLNAKYANEATSGFTFTVKKDDNTIDLKLE